MNTAINQVTQRNAAMVEQSTAASHSMAQDAEKLSRLTSRFQISGHNATEPSPANIEPLRRPVQATKRHSASALKVVGRAPTGSANRKPARITEDSGWTEF